MFKYTNCVHWYHWNERNQKGVFFNLNYNSWLYRHFQLKNTLSNDFFRMCEKDKNKDKKRVIFYFTNFNTNWNAKKPTLIQRHMKTKVISFFMKSNGNSSHLKRPFGKSDPILYEINTKIIAIKLFSFFTNRHILGNFIFAFVVTVIYCIHWILIWVNISIWSYLWSQFTLSFGRN